MDNFYDSISSFPTSIFTVMLSVMLVFWIFAILGMFDIDFFPSDSTDDLFDADADLDGEIPGFIGLLHTLGLTGVPITIVLSIIALIGFLVTYLLNSWLLLPFGSGLVRYAIGCIVILVTLALSIPLTAQLIKPLRPLFVKHYAPSKSDFIGYICIVSSKSADETFGIGIIETASSSLQVDIRTIDGQIFSKGEKVRIAEYNKESDNYLVISEKQFNQLVD